MDMRDVGGWAVVGDGEKEPFRLVHVPSPVGPGAASPQRQADMTFFCYPAEDGRTYTPHTHINICTQQQPSQH